MELSTEQLLGGGAVALLVVMIALFLRRGSGSKKAQGNAGPPGLDKLVKAGRFYQAAELSLRHQRYDQALEYFLRAEKPVRAAQVARRMGNARQAAELYERAGMKNKAIEIYAEAGFHEKARNLRGTAAQAVSAGVAMTSEQQDALFDSPQAPASPVQAQQAVRQAAEALLGQGDIRGAADAYRDAGLIDEAVHLYVNALASPGEAAVLLADQGHNDRAAELFELAGQNERAAATWAEVGLASPKPELFLDRILGLSRQVAHDYLRDATGRFPVSPNTAELHYRYGMMLAEDQKTDQAVDVFITIQKTVGDYRDVGAQIQRLRVQPVAGPDTEGTPAEGEPAQAMPVYQPLPDEDLARLAREVADAAAEESRKRTLEALAEGQISLPALDLSALASGLEAEPVPEGLLEAARTAAVRSGPSTDSLQAYIAGRPCDLQNIEVYYRLGLAYLAAGNWSEALEAFDEVEETAPGYRDAYRRAEELRKWQGQLERRLTTLSLKGSKKTVPEPSRYTLQGELGRGGMAVVYRAFDTVLDREIALKFLSEEMGLQKEVRELFAREARAVAQLNHPNIVTTYDFGELEGRAFIAMEYVDGTSVRDVLAARGRLSTVEGLQVTVQLLDALGFAHERSIIHRDIKPSNLMWSSKGVVKLMDFGLAKSIARGAQASMVAGTPPYMSPEQLLGEEVDHRTDIFAAGVTLYEVLTGAYPFEGLNRTTPPASLQQHVATIPRVLDQVIAWALAVEPEERFQSAPEMAAPIRELLQDVQNAASSDLIPPPPEGSAQNR